MLCRHHGTTAAPGSSRGVVPQGCSGPQPPPTRPQLHGLGKPLWLPASVGEGLPSSGSAVLSLAYRWPQSPGLSEGGTPALS